ncbi:N-terminal domain of NEFA-interacting nuclear protein NIP30-domain-containing protein [Rhodofomes roseus]|uniref:N-terminal domain of NEFA-interacting nuclear protein NIP30-domain-containing protein n=1 Tax=Rhodofomes roseus TaxID=34475 RepID=A0ABQ8KGU7_9APHY|nr:N-terminal domain of NEFA-interacting nuclear protein NIP30-domain-containing protein [Rhodofomes roseus]KAH9837084.1 N-terminal domain of NEFA-interacting nuclear protein NIP30-domain-containing protein [Rhodofomes roseus]
MDDLDAIPSISSGAVGSRFVTQNDIDTAKARRDEQWKAAYARLGQEPPPPPAEDAFDGRSLAEKLAANRAAKQEEWEERNKLGNQFRALEEDEVLFLDSVLEKQREEERLREEMDGKELKSFREAVAARETAASKPAVGVASTSSPPQPAPVKSKAPAPAAKKDLKKSLKGVLVKKKSKPAASSPLETDGGLKTNSDAQSQTKRKESETSPPKDDAERDPKRRRVSESKG